MPLILWVRFLVFIGLRKLAKQMPLSCLQQQIIFYNKKRCAGSFWYQAGTTIFRKGSQKNDAKLRVN